MTRWPARHRTSPGPSNHIRLGSLRNQINCRRAYARFSRTISSRVAVEVAEATDVIHDLPIYEPAERPGLGRHAARQQTPAPRRRCRLRTAHRRGARAASASAALSSRSATAVTSTSAPSGDTVSAKCAVSGRPVWKYTSSARIEPLAIARLNAIGRRRIDAPHHPPEKLDAAPRRDAFEALAQLVVLARSRKQAARQGAEVEAGAADENRRPAARLDVANRRRGVTSVVGRRVFARRLDDVDQVMRDAAPIGAAAPCRSRCRSRDRRRSNRS